MGRGEECGQSPRRDAVPVSVLHSPEGFVRIYKKGLLHPLPSGRASNSPAPPILDSLAVLRAIISKENTQYSCTNKLHSAQLINKVTVACRITII